MVGFIVGLIFAILSYLFYFIGVALLAGSLGYALGVGFMGLIGLDLTLITWLVGIVVAVIVAGATLLLNIQKWVIIAITSLGGAGVLVGNEVGVGGGGNGVGVGRILAWAGNGKVGVEGPCSVSPGPGPHAPSSRISPIPASSDFFICSLSS